MSVASRYAEMQKHVGNAYTEISRLGVDLTNVDKNIDNIADMLQEAYSQAPKVTGEGSSLSLTPTRKSGLSIIPKGACEQDTYSGKNQLPPTASFNVTNQGTTFTGDGNGTYTISGTNGNQASTDHIIQNYVIKENDYLHCGNNVVNGNCALVFIVDNDVFSLSLSSENRIYSISHRAGQTIKSLRLFVNGDYNGNAVTLSPMIINNVSTVTDFEKYVGGIPSPNPDYPQDIRVVTGDNSVVVQNKNLFDINWLTGSNITIENGVATGETRYFYTNFSQDAGGIPNTNFGNKRITLSFDYYTDGNQGTPDNDGIALSVIYTNGTETKIRLKNNVTTKTRYSLTSTNGKEISMICFSYYNLGQNIVHFSDIQVELGSTATSYVAHQEQTYTLHLGTNYLAGIGDYKDEIVGKTDDWKIARKVGKVVLNGSENWSQHTSDNVIKQDYYFARTAENNPKQNETITQLCNLGVYDYSGYYINSYNKFAIKINDANTNIAVFSANMTTTQWKEFLTNNNLIAYYPKSTPTEETITDTTLINDLNNMYQALSYDGTTNITITSDTSNAQMTASVSALKGE